MAERYRLGQGALLCWHRNTRLGTVPAMSPSVSTCHQCWDSTNLCGSSVSALSAGPFVS